MKIKSKWSWKNAKLKKYKTVTQVLGVMWKKNVNLFCGGHALSLARVCSLEACHWNKGNKYFKYFNWQEADSWLFTKRDRGFSYILNILYCKFIESEIPCACKVGGRDGAYDNRSYIFWSGVWCRIFCLFQVQQFCVLGTTVVFWCGYYLSS